MSATKLIEVNNILRDASKGYDRGKRWLVGRLDEARRLVAEILKDETEQNAAEFFEQFQENHVASRAYPQTRGKKK